MILARRDDVSARHDGDGLEECVLHSRARRVEKRRRARVTRVR